MATSDLNEIYLSPAPHFSSGLKTWHIMLVVILSLIPLAGYGVYLFGLPAALTILISVASTSIFEALFRKITHQKNRNADLSAIVTGLMLAMVLPPSTAWWMTVLGAFFAIVIAKEFFGGLGANVFNPALSGRAFLLVSFSASMTSWASPFVKQTIDAVSAATPLQFINAGEPIAKVAARFDWISEGQAYWKLLIGQNAGCIGESCSLLIILAFILLTISKIIDWRAPVAMIATVIVMSFAFQLNPLAEVLSGGLLFGAVFMATDYSTTPVTPLGRLIFGFGAGMITILIRKFGSYPEGVMFSILIMNVLTSYLNHLRPRKYGYKLKETR